MSWHEYGMVSQRRCEDRGEKETRDIRHISPGRKILVVVLGETKTTHECPWDTCG